jgi:hypothetical protein
MSGTIVHAFQRNDVRNGTGRKAAPFLAFQRNGWRNETRISHAFRSTSLRRSGTMERAERARAS